MGSHNDSGGTDRQPMTRFPRLGVLVRGWLRPGRVDREFREELRFHVEREAEANRDAGLSPEDALRAAHLSIGALPSIEEQSRDRRPGETARRAGRELLAAARRLSGEPWYGLAAVATLGLCIGATIAVYTAIPHLVFDAVAVPDPASLVVAWDSDPRRGLPVVELTYRDAEALARSRSFVAAGAMSSSAWPATVGERGDRRRIAARGVTPGFFAALGVAPLYGRVLDAADDRPHTERVAVLSHRLWQSRFAGDPSAVGRTLTIDGLSMRVVGVMPQSFDYPPATDIWIAVAPVLAGDDPDPEPALTSVGVLFLVGRLKPEATLTAARDELQRIAQTTGGAGQRLGSRVTMQPLVSHLLGPMRPALWSLFAAVSILLLIGCSSVSALMLTRMARRYQQHVVRRALGASPSAIARMWLLESLTICAAAGVTGLMVGHLLTKTLVSLAPGTASRAADLTVDTRVTLFTLIVVSLTTLACAAIPAREVPRVGLADALNGGNRQTADRRSHRLRTALMSVQSAFTVVLVLAAALVVESYAKLQALDLGFQPHDVFAFHVEPRAGTPTPNGWMQYLIERLSARGDVDAVGAVSLPPLAAGAIGNDSLVRLDGDPDTAEAIARHPLLNLEVVTPGYFIAMRMRLEQGRWFNNHDTARSPRVALISESAARTLWPHQNPVGQRFLLPRQSDGEPQPWRTVIGVVSDVRYRGLNDVRLDVYDLAAQSTLAAQYVVIRSHADARALTNAVRREARQLDADAMIDDVVLMEEVIAKAMGPWRLSVWIFGFFAGLALLLTVVGLFSVVSLDIASRRRELAIRQALGSSRRAIVAGVVLRALATVAIGLAAGFAASLFALRGLQTVLFEVRAFDARVYAAVGVILAAAVALAALTPALSATRRLTFTRLQTE
jgi:predicted permease